LSVVQRLIYVAKVHCGYVNIFPTFLGKAKPFTSECISFFSDVADTTEIVKTSLKYTISLAALANNITGLSSNNTDVLMMGYRRFF